MLSQQSQPSQRWIVSHSALDGMEAKNVVVVVECPGCLRRWQLPTANYVGIMHARHRRHAIQMPLILE